MAIKVLHIVGGLRPGGAEICLKNIVENTHAADIQQWIYPLRNNAKDIDVKANVLHCNYFNYDPRKFLAIIRFCKQYDIDIIHCHLVKAVLLGLLVKKFTKTKVIVHEHGSIFHSDHDSILYRVGLKILKNQADLFLGVSQYCADKLIESVGANPQKIQVFHNAVDLKRFDINKYDREHARKKLAIEKNDIVLGFTGRLKSIKGVDLLVPAFAKLQNKFPNLKLVIVGDGPLKEKMIFQAQDNNIADKIIFTGFVENVAEVMAAFDIALMPSREESFGIAAIEAMAMQKPLICTGVNGLAELAIDGQTAIVCKGDSDSLAGAIETLVQNDELKNLITKNAFKLSQDYALDDQVDKLAEIYRELLA